MVLFLQGNMAFLSQRYYDIISAKCYSSISTVYDIIYCSKVLCHFYTFSIISARYLGTFYFCKVLWQYFCKILIALCTLALLIPARYFGTIHSCKVLCHYWFLQGTLVPFYLRYYWIISTRYYGIMSTRFFGIISTRCNDIISSRYYGIISARYNGIISSKYYSIISYRYYDIISRRYST